MFRAAPGWRGLPPHFFRVRSYSASINVGAEEVTVRTRPREAVRRPGRHGRTGGPADLHRRWLPLWRHRSRLPLVVGNAMVEISCLGRRGGGKRTGSRDRL